MKKNRFGMGWLKDYPDVRDFTMENKNVKPLYAKLKFGKAKMKIPASVDLREWCSPIEDQENIGSCTAHAGVGLLEYFERRAFNNHIDASRLFLYKTTRNLMGCNGDTGAYLRSTMGALALFGVPPEKYLPYDTQNYDDEPPCFLYSFAQNFQALQYYRLDVHGVTTSELLTKIKENIVSGIPLMFGFTVYDSISDAGDGGKIPFPTKKETVQGGHAIDAVGYDDKIKIKNTSKDGIQTNGALLIRNSWGTGWGDGGYGWLPYEYVLQGLAADWWTLVKAEWVYTGQFGE